MSEWACSVDWPTAVGVIRDIVLSIVAVITATVAIIGINNWRNEGKARAQFEAARDFVTATLDVREALDDARVPLISYLEYPPPPDGDDAVDPHSGKTLNYVYGNRWTPVKKALETFREAAIAAEVLFGSEVGEKANEIKRHAQCVAAAMNTIIEQAFQGNPDFEDAAYRKLVYSDAHSARGNTENERTKKLYDAVEAIQDFLRSKLAWAS